MTFERTSKDIYIYIYTQLTKQLAHSEGESHKRKISKVKNYVLRSQTE